MIEMWRAYFKRPKAFFGFVELEPWCQHDGANCVGPPHSPPSSSTLLADFRAGQLSSLSLPNVGFAIATDIGDPTGPFSSIHPRNKKLVGKRLAAAALTIAYGIPTTYLPPTYKSSTYTSAVSAVIETGTSEVDIVVTVQFDNVPTTLVPADDHCKIEHPYNVSASQCAWFTISVTTGVGVDTKMASLNASATVGVDGKSLVLTATSNTAVAGVGSTGKLTTAFGWGAWPINTITSAEGLPLQPWTDKPPNATTFSPPMIPSVTA
jgi:hypothetical protein